MDKLVKTLTQSLAEFLAEDDFDLDGGTFRYLGESDSAVLLGWYKTDDQGEPAPTPTETYVISVQRVPMITRDLGS